MVLFFMLVICLCLPHFLLLFKRETEKGGIIVLPSNGILGPYFLQKGEVEIIRT